jgi:hypothetical protein
VTGPVRQSGGKRRLDFVVIGVQKGGTTSLWQYLRGHPQVAMPDHKEAPILCAREDRIPGLLTDLVESELGDAPPEAKLGKVAAHYMMGRGSVDIESIVDRIDEMLPGVNLIALLRDPIERAISHYRMSVRRGLESRPFEQVVDEELAPRRLQVARSRPTETNSYLAQGEYGRVLGIYRRRLPAEQILVEMSADLEAAPGAVLDRVLAHIGLQPGYRPTGLDVRHHRGGTRSRLDAEALEQLEAFMAEQVWPLLCDRAERARKAFEFFLQTWNVAPDEDRPPLSSAKRRRLEAHYRADAERLESLDLRAPWIAGWDAQAA